MLPESCRGTYLTKWASLNLDETISRSRGYPSSRWFNGNIILSFDWLPKTSLYWESADILSANTEQITSSRNPRLSLSRRQDAKNLLYVNYLLSQEVSEIVYFFLSRIYRKKRKLYLACNGWSRSKMAHAFLRQSCCRLSATFSLCQEV